MNERVNALKTKILIIKIYQSLTICKEILMNWKFRIEIINFKYRNLKRKFQFRVRKWKGNNNLKL